MLRRKNVPAFIRNTYEMLEREELKEVVCWCEGGNGFVIKNLQVFSQTVLPQYFKHKKYTSFVRQLNMYGFHKQRHKNDYHYYGHQFFKKGILEAADTNLFLATLKRKPQKKKKLSNDKLEEDRNELSLANPQNVGENESSLKRSVSLSVEQQQRENKCQMEQQYQSKFQKMMKNEEIMEKHVSDESFGRMEIRNQGNDQMQLNEEQEQEQQSNKSKQICRNAELILQQNLMLRKMHTLIREGVLKCKQFTIKKLEGQSGIEGEQPLECTNQLTRALNEQIVQLQGLMEGCEESE